MIRQLLLLGVLMDGKMHAYRLNEYVKHAMSFYTDLKKSTAYYILEQLEKDGYVTYEMEREGKRPERRIYEITEQGKSYFLKLLRDYLGDYTQVSLGDNVAAAFIERLPPEEVQKLLRSKRKKIKAQIEKVGGITGHGGSLQYVVNHNIAHLRADLKWVAEMTKDIGKEK